MSQCVRVYRLAGDPLDVSFDDIVQRVRSDFVPFLPVIAVTSAVFVRISAE